MKVRLNGKEKTFDGAMTIADLLARLNLPPGPVAAQVNEEIIHRDRYDAHIINDGDVIEIFTMLGGADSLRTANNNGVSQPVRDAVSKKSAPPLHIPARMSLNRLAASPSTTS